MDNRVWLCRLLARNNAEPMDMARVGSHSRLVTVTVKRQSRRSARYAFGFWSPAVLLLISCASAPGQPSPTPIAQSLLGKSEKQILECAGKPINETRYGQGVILRFYKGAPTFEGTTTFLEGSQPMKHQGCWARLLIENDQVIGVEFRTVPEGAEKADDKCDEIFGQCGP